jgi:uncharacterized protein
MTHHRQIQSTRLTQATHSNQDGHALGGTLDLIRHDNILAIRSSSGLIFALHTENLQVAHLDPSVWEILSDTRDGSQNQELIQQALAEIQTWNDEHDPNVSTAKITQSVHSLSINVSQVCNLRCNYCAAGGDGTYGDPVRHVDLETVYSQIRMLLHDLPEGEDFEIRFFGGEPLLATDTIRKIVRFAKLQTAGRKVRLNFAITTNGTLLTPSIAGFLASFGCHVTVSLDGPPEINDLNRKTWAGKGTAAKVIQGLNDLQAVRDRLGSLRVTSVFGKHNTGVMETYRFLRPFRFDSLEFEFAAEAGDEEASRAFTQDLLATADLAFREGGEQELRRFGAFDTFFRILDQQRRVENYCGAGKSSLQSDAHGKLSACPWFINDPDEELGQGIAIDQNRLAAYAAPLTELNDCQSCWARHLCGGGCMYVNKVKTGHKHDKDQDFCTRTRTIVAKAVEHYAKSRHHQAQGASSEIH